ncbi:MAG: hypothetical protein EA426_19715 [Spirochaetaceae bacterium]|nr:MAG: hypothetical protein EA426_19715 [Spirochaetaceae bacterium]
MNSYESTHIERLTDALTELNSSEELGKLARLTGSRVPTRKADLADHIARYLAGDGLRKAYDSLGELERAAIAEVVHSETDTFDAERFLAKYGSGPTQEPDELDDPSSFQRQPALLDMFLIGRNRLMPREIKRRLKKLVPAPAAVTLRTIPRPAESYPRPDRSGEAEPEAIPVCVHLSEHRAQRELPAVLRLIDSQKITVGSKTLRPSKATIDAVSAVLDGDDFYRNDRPAHKYYDPNPGAIRAYSWPIILHAAELARLSGNRLELTVEGRNALSSPPGEVMRRVWERWISASELDELSRIECVKGQTGKGGRSLTSTIERRKALQNALALCPTDEWIEIDELVRFMRASGIDATVTKNAWELYIGHREYGSLGYSGGAEVLDRGYLKAFLLEYAATMGLIDVALIPPADTRQEIDRLWGVDELPYFSRYDGLVAIRINQFGAYCLGKSTQYCSPMDEAERFIRVLPNRDVVTGTAISTADRLALDRYFEPESDMVWRIDAEKLLSLVEAGGTIEQVREYLLAHSETSLPQTVTQLLDDVEERSRRVSDDGVARLIECDDATLASLIAHDAHTRRHCMLAGSRHLVVPRRSEAAFKRGLKKVGFIVRSTADA